MTDNELSIELLAFLSRPHETVRRSKTYKVIRKWAEGRWRLVRRGSGRPFRCGHDDRRHKLD